MDAGQQDAARKKVFDLIKSIEVAQMVTVDSERQAALEADGRQAGQRSDDLWFFTSAASGKIGELEHNHEVLLTYSDPSRQNYVSIEGEGEVVRDPAKTQELWSEASAGLVPERVVGPGHRARAREDARGDLLGRAVEQVPHGLRLRQGRRDRRAAPSRDGDVGHVEVGKP